MVLLFIQNYFPVKYIFLFILKRRMITTQINNISNKIGLTKDDILWIQKAHQLCEFPIYVSFAELFFSGINCQSSRERLLVGLYFL